MKRRFRIAHKQAGEKRFSVYMPLALILFFLFSCAAVGIEGHGPDYNRSIENIPFYPQKEYQCGPASLAGVLNFWKIDVTPADITKEIYSKSAKGTLDIDMVFYPQKKGLHAKQYSGNMKDLRDNIDSDYPLIVFVDYGFLGVQSNHFMVVTGYNNAGVIVNSGKERGKFIPEEDFIRTWKKTGFWTLLVKKG